METYERNINKKSILIMLIIVLAVASVGTFAWLSYRSNDTAMVLTIGEIDGLTITLSPYQINGSINPVAAYTSGLVTNVTANNKKTTSDRYKLYYQIDTIDQALIDQGFKYTITKSTNSGSTYTVVKNGNFSSATNNQTLEIYTEEVPANTTYLYKVYLWIDSSSGNQSAMQNKSFIAELRAEIPKKQTVYTVNLYDDNATGYNSVWIGQSIPNGITAYNTPEAAITALEAAYSNANSGATTSLPFYLKHTTDEFEGWCDVETSSGNQYECFSTENECNQFLVDNNYTETDTCNHISLSNAVTESYVGFVVTSTMAANNPGMTAGTYYLRGGDNGAAYNDNKTVLQSAFGASSGYCNDYSSGFYCNVPGLGAYAFSTGFVGADDGAGSYCYVDGVGDSDCGVIVDGGGGGNS